MSHRFYVPPVEGVSAIDGRTASLDGPEAHHLLHVMRAKPGDQVTLFDGSGAEWPATVAKIGRSQVGFELGERQQVDRELPFPLVVGVAMPKGDRQKTLVEKLTELGVTRLVPLITERSVATLKSSALEKLRRTVIEASKQCGRNRLMTINEPTRMAEFLGATPAGATTLLAHPTGTPLAANPVSGESWVAIGPEGGFTDDEVALAAQENWQPASLGPRVLRIETAAQAFAAVLGLPADAPAKQ